MENKPKEKFYLWVDSRSYGWRPMGCLSGYDTIEELKKDCEHYFEKDNNVEKAIYRSIEFKEVQ